MIGNAEYQCSCVQYMVRDYTPVMVGVSVSAALLLFLLLLIITLCRRHHIQQAGYKINLPTDQDKYHNTKLPDHHHVILSHDDGIAATTV